VAISGAGVMSFADPVAAFVNIRGALQPGGRLAFVGHRETNDTPVLDALLGAGIILSLATQAPGVPTFTDPEQVRDILTAAGFRSEAATPFQFSSTIHGTASDAAGFLLNGNLRALGRRCVSRLGNSTRPWSGLDQMAWASSVNAAAMRRPVGHRVRVRSVRVGGSV